MRTRQVGAALALAAALAAGRAAATIDRLESSCGIVANDSIPIVRGFLNDITVSGFGVDLATSVTTTLSGVPATVLSRKNGFGSNIVVRLAPPSAGSRANGTVTLHYVGGGIDSFGVSVNATPTVSSIAFVPGGGVATSGGITRVTSLDPHVVDLRGANLDSLVALVPQGFFNAGLRDARVVLQLPGELRISFTSLAGDRSIDASLFIVNLADFSHCRQDPPAFTLAFTVFDPPRTPTPTPTATPTRTPTPLPFHPIAPPTGIHPPFPTPTPTPGLRPLLPPKR